VKSALRTLGGWWEAHPIVREPHPWGCFLSWSWCSRFEQPAHQSSGDPILALGPARLPRCSLLPGDFVAGRRESYDRIEFLERYPVLQSFRHTRL